MTEKNKRLQAILSEFENSKQQDASSREKLISENPDLAEQLQDYFRQQVVEQETEFLGDDQTFVMPEYGILEAANETNHNAGNQTIVLPESLDPTRAPESNVDAPVDPAETIDTEIASPQPESDTQAETVLPAKSAQKGQSKSNNQPTVIGDYELIDQIGHGGMGVVYRAKQRSLDRIVALKMIRSGTLASKREVERFKIEAESAAELDHPGIVPVFEVGESRGTHFFSMGFVEGQSLGGKLKDGPLPPKDAAKLLLKLVEAVSYAHERGVIHRDLKPDNVLLDKKGQPRITDFGLAKRLDSDSEQTRSGEILGTPAYMPPEQAAGRISEIGPRADIYSLGAVLYAMLTVRPPFHAPSSMETVRQVLSKEPVALRQLDSGIPRDLETICLKCLQKPLDKRYQSATALAEDLSRFIEGKPIEARPVSLAEHGWMWCKRNPGIAIPSAAASALALVLMIGGPVLAANFYQQKEKTQANFEFAVANSRIVLDDIHKFYQSLPAKDAEQMKGILENTLESAVQLDEKNESTLADMLLSSTYKKFGEVYYDTGELKKSNEKLEESLAIAKKLQATGRLTDVDFNLSGIYELLGRTKLELGDYDAAIAAFQSAIDHLDKWKVEEPDQAVGCVQQMAGIYGQLRRLAELKGDPAKARKYAESSLRMRKDWVALEPNNSKPKRELAGALRGMAQSVDEFPAKENYMIEGISLLEDLAKSAPSDGIDHNIALFAYELADIYVVHKNPAKAVELYELSAQKLTNLREKDPMNKKLPRYLAECYDGIAHAYDQLNEPVAQEFYQKVLEIREKEFAKNATKPNKEHLMFALAHCGDHLRATRLAKELKDNSPDESNLKRIAACYAICMSTVGDQESLKAKYLQSAFDSLNASIDKGWKDAHELRIDPDMESLRDEEEFKAILKRIN